MKKLLLLASLAAATTALAQVPLTLPEVSPAASVSQTVGLTEMKIDYHRPAVNGRKIWGEKELVPYNEVWRAGANENTTISFSDDVTVEGQPLPAGTYGLHMIPTPTAWTVIFSKQSHAWGSYSYDQKEDALRVTVAPQTMSDSAERLTFSFDDPTDKSTVVALRWEKLRVPFRVDVDVAKTVAASLRDQLRGRPRFSWQGWNNAAGWLLRNGGDLNEALDWANSSIKIQPTFQNLRTKAAIVEKQGDAKQAEELRARAMGVATEGDLNAYGSSLLGQKKVDEALDVFKRNAKEHPTSMTVWNGLGDAYAAKGDKKAALESYNKALSMATTDEQKKRITDAMAKVK
jgi:tetratricopeptide (TPR) repeat protein